MKPMMFPSLTLTYGDADAPIRQTDCDASAARLSAVQKQYLQDPFVHFFVPRPHLQQPRPPLINIGTFVRSTAIDDLVRQWFLLSEQEGKPCQIVSLGAGSDTRFWRIATSPQLRDHLATYVELDFPEVTGRKVMAIRKSKELSAVLGPPTEVTVSRGGTMLHSPVYHLLPADLRLPPQDTLSNLLSSPGSDTSNSSGVNSQPLLSANHPTLLLFECVLVYMSPSASSALIQWFVDYFSTSTSNAVTLSRSGCPVLGGIVYEMFGLGDAFGRVMLSNLQARNVTLPGAEPYHSISSLPRRFLDHGFTNAKAVTLRDFRRRYIGPAELERISNLEMLDEIEELELVLEHYAVTWGVKLFSTGDTFKAAWNDWGVKQKDSMDTGPCGED